MGWFLTPSEVKRAAVRPMARVGGLVALMLAAAVASTASAEPMRDRDRDEAARQLQVQVTGRIKASCQLNGGGELNMGELRGGERATALFGLDCNVRRRNIWRRFGVALTESGPRQGLAFRRRACGAASGDVRWSVS